ncbi:MAG: hypothetical protein GSR73_00590 [Desulfurococcales archaeon]|nr:hypothetical protein [Desulfurococcales archaeon]
MSMTRTAWLIASEDAERYRAMARKARNPHRAAVLRMAANVLEQAAWEIMNGRVSSPTLENLQVIESLLKSRGMPVGPVRRARSILMRMIRSRIEDIVGVSSEALGLP